MDENQIVITLLIIIGFTIALGLYLINPTYADLTCVDMVKPYTILEEYKELGYETRWGNYYNQILDKVSISIYNNRPNYISYELCSPCRYNITFIADKPTNFYIFDEYNKERYFNRESAFPIALELSGKNETIHIELGTAGKYYFVFDRSSQGTVRNDPATGRLIIEELVGRNQTTRVTKYKEATIYREVTYCE